MVIFLPGQNVSTIVLRRVIRVKSTKTTGIMGACIKRGRKTVEATFAQS